MIISIKLFLNLISQFKIRFIKDFFVSIRPNKRIPVFRVPRPYLNLLVKPEFFQVFFKKTFVSILKGELTFKVHKMILFSRKNK